MSRGFDGYMCSEHAMVSYLDEKHSPIDEETSDLEAVRKPLNSVTSSLSASEVAAATVTVYRYRGAVRMYNHPRYQGANLVKRSTAGISLTVHSLQRLLWSARNELNLSHTRVAITTQSADN